MLVIRMMCGSQMRPLADADPQYFENPRIPSDSITAKRHQKTD